MLEKKLYLGLTMLLSAVMGCGNNDTPNAPAENGTQQNHQGSIEIASDTIKQGSPQEVFDSFKTLMEENNWEQAANCLTEESQASVCGALIFVSSMISAFDADNKKGFEEILEKHELDLEKEPPAGVDPKEDDPFAFVGKQIKNKPSFLSDVGNWLMKTSNDQSGFSVSDQAGKLKDLKIVGDTATAIVEMKKEDKPLEFVKQNNKWLIHIPPEAFEMGEPSNETTAMEPDGNTNFNFNETFDDFDFGFDEEEKLPAFDAMTLKQYEAAWQLNVDVKDQPVGEVIKKITTDCGLDIFEPEKLKELFEQKVTIKLEKVSPVQAMEKIAAQFEYYPRYRLKTITFSKGKRTTPALFQGPFVVIVKKVEEYVPYAAGSVDLQFFAAGLPTAAIAQFKKVVLSNNNPKQNETSWEINSVTGTGGKDILVASDPDAYSYSSARITKKTILFSTSISLMNLLKPVSQVEKVEGNLSFSIPTKIHTLIFEKLEKGETVEQGDIKLTLKRVQLRDNSSSVSFDFEGSDTSKMIIVGLGPDEKIIEINGGGGYTQNGKGNKSAYFSGKPVKLKVLISAETEKLSYPVAFEDIKLQHCDKMPETVPQFKFSGEAPVSIKFLKFIEKDNQKKILFEVKNQSNRDISSLSFSMDFLDNNGKKIKDFPHSHSGQRNMLPAGKTVEISTSTFGMPDGTKSVSPRVWSIWFADNTKWAAKR